MILMRTFKRMYMAGFLILSIFKIKENLFTTYPRTALLLLRQSIVLPTSLHVYPVQYCTL